MPSETLSVYVGSDLRAAIERAAAARGLGVSTWARQVLLRESGLLADPSDGRLEALERRIGRLEEMAGL